MPRTCQQPVRALLPLLLLLAVISVPLVTASARLKSHAEDSFPAGLHRRALLQTKRPEKTTDSRNKTVLLPAANPGSIPVATVVDTDARRPLAVTSRPNPADSLNDYRGGYDLRNKDYWASVVWTGAWGYITGVAWLLLGLLSALLGCFYLCCCRRNGPTGKEHGRAYYWIPALLTILAALTVIAGSIVVYAGNGQFYDDAKGIKNYVVTAADNTTADARYVANTLQAAQPVVATVDASQAASLSDAVVQLNDAADQTDNTVANNEADIDRGLRAIEYVLIIIAACQLFLAVLGLLGVFLKWRPVILIALLFAWLFCCFAFLLSGLYFFVHHLVGDTCTAMREYADNPYNTTLDSLLPCVDLLATQASLREARGSINNLVGRLNAYITQGNNLFNSLPTLPSIPGIPTPTIPSLRLPTICVPYGSAPDYAILSSCPVNTVPIANISTTFSGYRCSSSDTLQCLISGTPLTPDLYNQVAPLAQTADNITRAIPVAEGLANCSFVINTFEYLSGDTCRSTRKHVRIIWIGFLVAGIGLALLSVLWSILMHRARVLKRQSKYGLEGADMKDQFGRPPAGTEMPVYRSAPSTSKKKLLPGQQPSAPAYPTA